MNVSGRLQLPILLLTWAATATLGCRQEAAVGEKPRYTLHYAPAEYFESLDAGADYIPPEFEQDGFIYCTDGAENMARVATAIYRDDPRDFLVLYIDKSLVAAPIKYEDPGEIYPHIYGPIPRSAIIKTAPAPRAADGSFLPPPRLSMQ